MKYRINLAGNRIVDATPEEIYALMPCVEAAFRRWRANEADIEDGCQQVAIVTWQAVAEGRVVGERLTTPEDALMQFMHAVAWNIQRNHTRRHWTWREVLHDELPDVGSEHPDHRLESRDVLRRISMHSDVARILLVVLDGPYPERREGLPKSTFWSRVHEARRWVRDVDAGHWQAPKQPIPPTPWKRKGKR